MTIESNFDFLMAELESLGIRKEDLHEPHDIYEIKSLVDDIKQAYIQNYRSTYDYDYYDSG